VNSLQTNENDLFFGTYLPSLGHVFEGKVKSTRRFQVIVSLQLLDCGLQIAQSQRRKYVFLNEAVLHEKQTRHILNIQLIAHNLINVTNQSQIHQLKN
jgi:NAD kinase